MNQSESSQIDKAIISALPPAPKLPADFEAQVLQRARSTGTNRIKDNLVIFAMAVYWTAAVSIAAWLLQNADLVSADNGAASGNLLALLPAFTLLVLPLLWMTRQVHTRITDLFLKTLQ